ncbi:hypothetical protein OSB04_017598 [Centaurea solstitialis]|uniref:Integrase catalytic domain-containing protein n=1 Tax=Centaurea solstitialis TaxID=347529 RepID=A0AA38TN61_9ASTR|nr:hypothetical protein OSB04_017598 [Centaurea solstitialis]
MDTGATAHLHADSGILKSFSNKCTNFSVSVGDGSRIPVTHTGSTTLTHNPYRTLSLNNVLITPQIIKNLISMTTGLVKSFSDVIARAIYIPSQPRLLKCSSLSAHPLGIKDLVTPIFLCFVMRVNSENTFGYHLLYLNLMLFLHFMLFILMCGLLLCKVIVVSNFMLFSLINFLILFGCIRYDKNLRCFQNSYIFVCMYKLNFAPKSKFSNVIMEKNLTTSNFTICYSTMLFVPFCFSTNNFSCLYTSQQNGKSERMLRIINNVVRTLLFQAHLPPTYWVEALHMASHLLNILPSTALHHDTPFHKLFDKQPSYSHLRVFGCLCYPHLNNSHKLEPRSTPCIFLGYPSNHKGYRCLNLHTKQVIISRHVVFDESTFPFGSMTPNLAPSYDFLDLEDNRNHFNNLNYPSHPTEPVFTPESPTPSTNDADTSTTPPTPPLSPSVAHPSTEHSSTQPSPLIPPSAPTNIHPMATRARHDISKPI